MKSRCGKTMIGGGILAGLGLFCAPAAFADTTSVVNVGNANAGYSVGTTGGSVSFGGTTTTVDGFGTLHGSTVVTQGKNELFSVRQDYTNGFDSKTSFNNGQSISETELYYNGKFEQSFSTPGQNGTQNNFELVCTPTKGCVTNTG